MVQTQGDRGSLQLIKDMEQMRKEKRHEDVSKFSSL